MKNHPKMNQTIPSNSLARPRSDYLDNILGEKIPLLDHGFIRVLDYMGTDRSVVQAARISYGNTFTNDTRDRNLIRYLMRHNHTSPFEMCEIKLHIKLPLFLARQWIRHRTANVNERSGRYAHINDEFYIPEIHTLAPQKFNNKQGREDGVTVAEPEKIIAYFQEDTQQVYEHYKTMLDHHQLSRELARIALPLNTYTEMYWKIDLHNLLHFLHVRLHNSAQYEIRLYAEALYALVQQWVPWTCDAFDDYKKKSYSLSAQMLQCVKRYICGETVLQEDSGLSQREWEELQNILER